ncbi:hypothetical protein NC651_005170 [Populus alba x Populus x berolinensis]|nr:hypothetical protein NC651_005170 [Populus alba x Populus x berolinensis]
MNSILVSKNWFGIHIANRSTFSGLPGGELLEFELLFVAICIRIHGIKMSKT